MDDMTSWHQVNIEFPDWERAEQIAATLLFPQLEEIEHAVGFWFIRKRPCWRLRYHADQEGSDLVGQTLDVLADAEHIARWTPVVYEPEIHAFGGPDAMRIAHRLFHHDSQEILACLKTRPGHRYRREISLMLCSIMMRAARQDFFEQGDVWARVLACRPATTDENPVSTDLPDSVRKFLTADAEAQMNDEEALGYCARWADAYAAAGTDLADFAATGQLHRGLRGVLSHHVIFAWNRLGLPYETQRALASAAKTAVFGPDPAAAREPQ